MAKNDLKTLIRVHQFELDEKRRQLGNLLRFEQSLENRKILLAKRFKEEEEAAKNDQTAALTFGAYVIGTSTKQNGLNGLWLTRAKKSL